MDIYTGSHFFLSFSESIGLPIDQFNFVFCELFALFLGVLFRTFLKPCAENTLKRHLISLLFGVPLALFCYGEQVWCLLFHAIVCYLFIIFVPRKYVHIVVLVFSMTFLTVIHVYRMVYYYQIIVLDITGPLMVNVQKITAFAFAYYDGTKKDEVLSIDQKQQLIRNRPTFFEYFGYMFNFQTVIVGPLCFYQDYIDYITGNNILKHQQIAILTKLIQIIIFGVIFIKVSLYYTIQRNLDESILRKPFVYRLLYMWFAGFTSRMKYYIAWILAEIVCNASGLGFNGFDENGKPIWNLMTNVNIYQLETATSMKLVFDSWNIKTQIWLRRICFDRLPTLKTLGVFVLSAIWHGVYPGYYFTFVYGAFCVYSGRGIRRKIRPFFQKNQILKYIYAVLTWTTTSILVSYGVSALDLCDFFMCIKFYNSMYWCFSICIVVVTIFLPGGSKKTKVYADKKTEKIQ